MGNAERLWENKGEQLFSLAIWEFSTEIKQSYLKHACNNVKKVIKWF